MTLQIRPMTEADLATAIGWAAAEGWNPGLVDAGSFRAELANTGDQFRTIGLDRRSQLS